MKADDKECYEGDDGVKVENKYTNFELLVERVDVLEKTVVSLTKVLKENNIHSVVFVEHDEVEAYSNLEG